jgi:hypothetical protein
VKFESDNKKLVNCDTEDGGCGFDFVVYVMDVLVESKAVGKFE